MAQEDIDKVYELHTKFQDAMLNLVAAQIDAVGGFRVVDSETLFTLAPDILSGGASDAYDVGPDDQQFLMARDLAGSASGATDQILVLNLFEELRRRAPN
jgi:hypothetical protein